MNAYLWHLDGSVRHHLRAGSLDEARERIALMHGEEVARRAVILSLKTPPRAGKSESAAA